MLDIFLLIGTFRVCFGITGTADAEISAALLQFPDQIHSIAVIPVAAVLADHVCRQVAAQGHDVFNACVSQFLNPGLYGFPGGRNTGQMGDGSNAVIVLNMSGNIQCILTGTAAGAVCNVHKSRMQQGHGFCCMLYGFKGRGGFGRKHLKGHGEPLLFKMFGQFHENPPEDVFYQ